MKFRNCYFLLVFVILLLPVCGHAQNYFYNDNYYENDVLIEIGGSANAMRSATDLKTNKIHAGGGLFVSAIYKNSLAVRLEGTVGKVSGYDLSESEIAKGVTTYNRNLNYRSNIYEIALLAEVHPLSIINSIRNNDDAVTPFLSPYFLAGVGYFSFDPEGRIPNSTTWVRLQPLSTEGQGFPTYPEREAYKLQQVNFPFGLGVKYELNRLLNVRLEAVYHYLTTDYLDDVSTSYIDPADFDSYLSPVNAKFAKELADKQLNSNPSANGIGSQRGSPGVKDSYLSVSLKLSFILGRTKR